MSDTDLVDYVDDYDYVIRLEHAINKLGLLNLVNKESQQYLELLDLFKKYGIFKESEAELYKYSLEILSPKFDVMLNYINNSPGLVFLYSQFRSVEGIEIFSRVLSLSHSLEKLSFFKPTGI